MMQAGFDKVYELVEKARLSVPVDTNALHEIRDTYGYDLYKEALSAVLENHSLGWFLAERLNDFYKDFDFYDYMDKLEGTEDEAVAELAWQLEDPVAVKGILDTLSEIRKDGRLSEAQGAALDELVLDLSEVQEMLGKSIDDVVNDAVKRSEDRKTDSLTVDILQLKHGEQFHGLRFSHLDWLEDGVNSVVCKNYNHIYRYAVDYPADFGDAQKVLGLLEDVYRKFNIDHPQDFRGHSLSTSDVVVIAKENYAKAYYCDWIGFKTLPEKFVEDFKNSLAREVELF